MNLTALILRKASQKPLLVLLVLMFVFLVLSMTFTTLLTPIMIFAGDSIYNDKYTNYDNQPVGDIPEVLPEELQYVDIDKVALKTFLNSKNSILAEDYYISSICNAAKTYNVNPLLLFAITGQEQSFVPRTDKDAKRIANNPFNVFHSWMEYNTNIQDSATIAARTVVNLSKNRPAAVNPIAWINRKYAEDQGWWIGVSRYFKQLKESCLK